jgi:hypothetical protein
MRNSANAVLRMPSRTGSREALILDSVNAGERSPMGLGELVTILSTGMVDGRETALKRLFCDTAPGVVLSFFPSRGVDTSSLVSTYERVKAATGIRSEQFEKHLAGQFVFTSV